MDQFLNSYQHCIGILNIHVRIYQMHKYIQMYTCFQIILNKFSPFLRGNSFLQNLISANLNPIYMLLSLYERIGLYVGFKIIEINFWTNVETDH